MRSEKEIIGKAANVKVAMRGRISRIEMLAANIGKAAAGLAPEIKEDRLETMKKELDVLSERQFVDAHLLATFRWALGITDDIDVTNLELNL